MKTDSIKEATIVLGINKDIIKNWKKDTCIPVHKIEVQKTELDIWVKSVKSSIDN